MTTKKTPKAKNQRTVSRAVKEAGFKNIKEAKETLHKYKKEINSCCTGDSCGTEVPKVEKTPTAVLIEQYQLVITQQRERINQLEEMVIERTDKLRKAVDELNDIQWNDYYASLDNEKAKTQTTGLFQSLGSSKKADWLTVQAVVDGSPVAIRVWAVV